MDGQLLSASDGLGVGDGCDLSEGDGVPVDHAGGVECSVIGDGEAQTLVVHLGLGDRCCRGHRQGLGSDLRVIAYYVRDDIVATLSSSKIVTHGQGLTSSDIPISSSCSHRCNTNIVGTNDTFSVKGGIASGGEIFIPVICLCLCDSNRCRQG